MARSYTDYHFEEAKEAFRHRETMKAREHFGLEFCEGKTDDEILYAYRDEIYFNDKNKNNAISE